jgi:hypothetical protein
MLNTIRQRMLGSVCLGLCLVATFAHAQDAKIGYVKTVQDEAMLLINGKSIQAVPGMVLQTGYRLKTGPRGSMGVTFKDNTIMSIGPDTEIVLDEYLYAPAAGELKLVAFLLKGSLQYISGVIAHLKPEAVEVRTPVGLIGVRGTRFVALVEGVQP